MTHTTLEIGKPAPDFTLPDQQGNATSLKDYQGRWVVLYFYPKDDTPGCTKEACQFTAGLKDFETLNATVLGCSPDDTVSHQKFIDKYHLNLTLLSDPDHQVMRTYGAWGEKKMYGRTTEGVIRTTVLLDPDGKLAHHWKQVRADGHAEQVRKKLAELKGY